MMLGLSLAQIQQAILENQALFINECIFCENFAVKSNKLFVVVAKIYQITELSGTSALMLL